MFLCEAPPIGGPRRLPSLPMPKAGSGETEGASQELQHHHQSVMLTFVLVSHNIFS